MLGGLFALGIYINLVASSHLSIFGIYLSVMALFHFSEFIAIAIIQPNRVTANSFVLNHSPQYNIAAVTSWIEFFIEAYFFPGKYFKCSYICNIVNYLSNDVNIQELCASTTFI